MIVTFAVLKVERLRERSLEHPLNILFISVTAVVVKAAGKVSAVSSEQP